MSMQDSLTIGITVFTAAFTVAVLGVLRYVFLQSGFLAEMTAFQNAASAVAFFDYVPLAFLVGSFISSLYFSTRIRAHPIFLPISSLFLIVASGIGYFLSLLPEQMTAYTVFSEVFGVMGMTGTIMQNLHFIIFITGLIGMIAMYGINSTRGGAERAPL